MTQTASVSNAARFRSFRLNSTPIRCTRRSWVRYLSADRIDKVLEFSLLTAGCRMVADKDVRDFRQVIQQTVAIAELGALKQDRIGFECGRFRDEEALFALLIELDLLPRRN